MAAAAAPAGGVPWPSRFALDEPCLDMLCACSGEAHGMPTPPADVRWDAEKNGIANRIAVECRDADDEDGGRSERGGEGRSGAGAASATNIGSPVGGPGGGPAGERLGSAPGAVPAGAIGRESGGENPPGVEPTGSVLSAGSTEGGQSTMEFSVYDRFDDAFGIGRSRSGSLGIRGSWTDQLSAASSAGTISAHSSAGSLGKRSVGSRWSVGSVGSRSDARGVGGRSATSARSDRSRGGSGESAPAEAPGIPAPVVSAGERKGGTSASRRAALVRNLVARAMVHNNEARELLAGEGSPPMPLQVAEGAEEGSELAQKAELAEAAGEDAEASPELAEEAGEEEEACCPSEPPRRDPSAGGTGTPWIGLGEDGRDPPEEKAGELHPAPHADGGAAASLPTSVLFRPRDPLAGARPAGEWHAPASRTGAPPVRPRPEASWRTPGAGGAQIPSTLSLGGRQSGGRPDVIHGIGRLAAMERVDGRRAAARDELLRQRCGSGGRSVGGYSYSAVGHGRNSATVDAHSVGGRSFGGYSVGGRGRNLDAYRTPTPSPGGARLFPSPPRPTSPYRRSPGPAGGAPVPQRLGVPSLVPLSPPRSPAQGGLGISETASQLTSPTALLNSRSHRGVGGEGGAARRREYYRNLLLADGRRRRSEVAGAGWTSESGMNV